jgi:hypothetical protein
MADAKTRTKADLKARDAEIKATKAISAERSKLLKTLEKIKKMEAAGANMASTRLKTEEKIKKVEEQRKEQWEKAATIQRAHNEDIKDLTQENNNLLKTGTNIANSLAKVGAKQLVTVEQIQEAHGVVNDLAGTNIDHQTDISAILLDQIENTNTLNANQAAIGTEAFERIDYDTVSKDLAEERLKITTGQYDLSQQEVDAALETLGIAEQRLKVQKDISKFQEMQHDAVTDLQAPMNDLKDKAMGMAAQLKAVFANPALALVAGLGLAAKQMFDLFKGAQALKTELGISDEAAVGLQMQISEVSMSMKAAGVESADVADAQMALINNFGGVAASSTDLLMNMAKMKADLGVSGQSAGNLMVMMKATGAASKEAAFEMAKSVASLAQSEGVAPGQVMQDIANNTEAFAQYAKDGGMNVAKAAIQAKKLGINFETSVKIADNLLDFEGSIQKQMEAEILLGKQLNLDKARQLALTGDMEGLQKEVLKNVGTEAEFNAMNVLQRKALATSIGISVVELSKMVANQSNLNKQTESQQAMTDIMAMIMKEIRGLSEDLIKIWMVLKPIFMVALAPIGLAVWGLVKLLGLVASLVTWVDDRLGGGLSVVFGTILSIYLLTKLWAKEGLMASMKQYAMDLKTYIMKKKSAVLDKLSITKKTGTGGSGGKGGSSGLGFVEKINPAKMLAGAGALLIVSAALWVTAKALQEFTSVSWGDMAKAGVALLGLVLVVAALGMIMSGPVGLMILVGAAAMLILAAALLVLGFAIQAIGTGFGMLAEGLTSFTPILSTLVPLANGIFVLAGAFGALGIGMGALAIGALALLPALPVLLALAGIGMLGMALAGGGEENVAEASTINATDNVVEAESSTINAIDMTMTNDKLDGVISEIVALKVSNKELMTSLTGKVKALAEA